MSSQMVMGNQAIALGALKAGVNLVSGYPGTPSSEIIEYIANFTIRQNAHLVDEILFLLSDNSLILIIKIVLTYLNNSLVIYFHHIRFQTIHRQNLVFLLPYFDKYHLYQNL